MVWWMYLYCRYIPGIQELWMLFAFCCVLLRLCMVQLCPYPSALLGQPYHDDVIKWKHCPYYWPFGLRIDRSPENSPHKDQWRGALMFSLICVWINDRINNRKDGDSRPHRGHYDVILCDCAWAPMKQIWKWCVYIPHHNTNAYHG